MLTYSFEQMNGPIYEYLYECIRRDILNGRLKAGEKLPSKRSFAENHGISTITVQNAYEQLISEGYIFAVPKKGYYVAEVSAPTEEDVPAQAQVPAQTQAPGRPAFPEMIDLSGNRTDPEQFPFSIWARLLRNTISNRQAALMVPSPTQGIPELRNAIAGHLRSFRGVSVSPDQIVIGAGTEYLYGLLVQLLGNDKIYCVENPGYKKLTRIYAEYQIKCRFAGMDARGIRIGDLEKTGAQIAHISPTHHFPSGITMPVTRRYEVLNWAAAAPAGERYIIEDDYDSEFRQNGRPIPPLIGIDRLEKVIYINTFSKSLAPTIRISYMVLPPHLAERFRERLSFYSCTVSNFEQYTLAEFISGGYFEKHINRMRLFYRKRRAAILKCLAESRLGSRCTVSENDSGLHFLLKLDTVLPDREVKRRLAEHGIRLQALSEYDLNDEEPGSVAGVSSGTDTAEPEAAGKATGSGSSAKSRRSGRILNSHLFLLNYSNVDPEELKKAADIIAECL